MSAHERFLRLLIALSCVLASSAPLISQQSVEQKRPEYQVPSFETLRVDLLPRALEQGENPDLFKSPYTEGDRLLFRLQITNASNLPVHLIVSDPYAQTHPVLYRNGDLLPYRRDVSNVVERRESEVSDHILTRDLELQSNEAKILQVINLGDWYDGLGPGHYQFSIKYRFQFGQEWIESSSITFEIVPKPEK